MRRILVVGGANGIGLSIAQLMVERKDCEKVYIVDKVALDEKYHHIKIESYKFDLNDEDYSFFDRFADIDSIMITSGFGRLSLFKDVDESYIKTSFVVNSVAPIRIIHRFMDRMLGETDFYCGVMVSIAGFLSSPFFAVYGATKASLRIFIESVNVELEKNGSSNRILNVSPGTISGTSFYQGQTDLSLTKELAEEIIAHLENKDDLFIPKYNEIFRDVLERYNRDFREEGRHSYDYKLESGRI